MTVKVLIVDDNEMYRSAFKRNLLLNGYDVVEAENGDEGIRVFQSESPDVIVTDLSMRTPTEGLDLIRAVKQVEPLVPVVMISAVGTFEEGAEASRLGAHSVISKSRIDVEIASLYRTIESARASSEANRKLRAEVETISREESTPAESGARLREIVADAKTHPSIRGEAFDALMRLNEEELRRQLEERAEAAGARDLELVEATLAAAVPTWGSFEPETRKELRTAEYFYTRQGGDNPIQEADFSRNIGFSFCFAVENEAKARLRKRLHKFLSNRESIKLVQKLIDPRRGALDIFYHQYLARLQQMVAFDFTIDNVRQVFQRILEHESRYKPDGLKALGIMILCFGRDYAVKTQKESLKIANPLNLRGIETDEEVIHFVHMLVALQHYRNPYIHPEISEMEKISKIRETALECLRQVGRLA